MSEAASISFLQEDLSPRPAPTLDLDAINQELAGWDADQVIRWARATFGARLCVQSSMQQASSVILHRLAVLGLRDVPVLFGDTGAHFPETLATRDRIAAAYGLNIVTFGPNESMQEQARREGIELWRYPDTYERCCWLRKVEPWIEASKPYHGVIAGMRRAEGGRRRGLRRVEYDPRIDAYKIHPIVEWDAEDVGRYVSDHRVITHPLHDQGYPSIGCAPCTTPVRRGEDDRAGRWRHIREAERAESQAIYCAINFSDTEAAHSP